MNDSNSTGKMSFVEFNSVNVNGDWTNLVEKILQPGDKIPTTFRLS